jgi:hypothetical protein
MIGMVVHSLFALFGCLAKQLNGYNPTIPSERKKKERAVRTELKRIVTGPRFISESFVAVFTGCMIYYIGTSFALDRDLLYAASGISGWVGPSILDTMGNILKSKIDAGRGEAADT